MYGLIEIGIGAFGLLELILMPLVDTLYAAAVSHGVPSILFRTVICVFCLLPPTILMGASLPAIARWIKNTPRGVSWLGLLYGGNTAGAVVGCLLAGFWLLRISDMIVTTLVAAAINGAVALFSLSLAKRTPKASPDADSEAPRVPAGLSRLPVYLTIAISGATALGAEVVWTRLLGLMLGATVYTFSIILAIFLIGIGIGSWAGSAAARTTRSGVALGVCQLLLVAATTWTAFMISQSSLVAGESAAFRKPHLHLPDGFRARRLGDPATDAAVGRKFSARARRCRVGR